MSESLRQRLITAILLIGSFLLILYQAPPLAWSLFVLAVVAGGAWEWAGLICYPPVWRHAYATATAAAGLAISYADIGQSWTSYLPALLFWCLIVPVWLKQGWQRPGPWLGAAIGWLLLLSSLLAMIHLRQESPHLLLATVALAAVADSAAYFSGRAFGRHKLAPAISPGKTREGAVGGGLAVLAFGLALAQSRPGGCDTSCLPSALAVFLLLFVLSVLGDLFESWIKRQAGVKDSSQLLPGHGGILDRIDSHLAVLPAAALFWILLQ